MGSVGSVDGPRFRRREWATVLGQAARSRRGKTGLALVGVVVLLAAVGPLFAPYSSTDFVTNVFARPSHGHLFGGDTLGRDVVSRVLHGGWLLLIMAAAATLFGVVIGSATGVTAAYLGGKWDAIIMRTVDVVLAFPQLVFALLLVSVLGPRLWLIVVAVGVSHAPQVARVMRAAALDVSERDFVKAVELNGVRATTVMTREVFPQLTAPLMVEIGLRLTYSIIIMAGLAFLGFSQPPPAPNWGLMINENRIGLQANYWGVLAPILMIALLTIGMNTFTDAVAQVAGGSMREVERVGLQLGAGVAADLPAVDQSIED